MSSAVCMVLLAGSVLVVGAARAAPVGQWELVGYGLEKRTPHGKDHGRSVTVSLEVFRAQTGVPRDTR